ncbi:DUF4439 domain-containing protein [Corynebacterium crudilactis]|uniref:DUF4439 domain-containing protein n=1 Tax=Corynebacterium crudilactis TaxID=1652495 RepID=A0A172QU93_9CORY|nr:DUF4439 domain-containing protein [Corynebacterium crudilactis]ANE04263.1 hypothetical protein ccrud_08640 [Corynebacterium crudilactis]
MRWRIPIVLSVSLLSASLVACTPSPNPNETLTTMYQDALSDAQALSQAQPELSALRAEHADELLAEIHRVCGFDDEGTLPESCTVAVPDIAAIPTDNAEKYLSDSQALILDNLANMPRESIPLAIDHYIEESRFTQKSQVSIPTDLTLSTEELATAQELAAREYSASWALGVALAYLPATERDVVEDAIDNHAERAALLQLASAPENSEVAEPGYDSDIPAPSDEASARSAIRAIEDSMVQAWHAAASAATTDAWRVICAQIAGDTAREFTLIDAP